MLHGLASAPTMAYTPATVHLNVLLVTQDYPPAVGGIQRYAHALGVALAARVNSLCVLAPDQPGAAEFDAAQPHAVVRMATSSDWMRLRGLPAVIRTAKSQGSNTILTGHWYVAAAALMARSRGHVKQVYTAAHGQELLKDLLPGPLAALYRAHRRSVLTRVDGCFAISRYTGELLAEQGTARERIHIVPNGTEPARFDNPESRAAGATLRQRYGIPAGPLLATVGRLVPRKGIDTVIRALPTIRAAFENVRYAVAGSGPDRARLEALAARQQVSDRVFFLGEVPDGDVAALYQACDVFVMPARREGASVEGFGLVFREAGACGTAVIGAYSGGIPDAIGHGDTGLLVPPDNPLEFADAALRLLRDPNMARELGARGREVVNTTGTWDVAAERIAAVMEAGL